MMLRTVLGGLQEAERSIALGPRPRRLPSEGSAAKLRQLVAQPIEPPRLNVVAYKGRDGSVVRADVRTVQPCNSIP